MYRIKANKEIRVNAVSYMLPNLKTEHLFIRKIVEAEIENFKSYKFISSSENSQKHSKLMEDVNIVGQRCVAFFRVLFCGKLRPEG